MRLAADAECFIERGHDAVGFVAQMRPVAAVVLAHDAAERDQFVGRGESSRRINQCRRHSDRSGAHRLIDERLHLRQFGRCRCAIGRAEDDLARIRGSDVEREVDGRAVLLDDAHEIVERSPRGIGIAGQTRAIDLRRHRIIDRTRRMSLARDLGGHALPDFSFELGIEQHRSLGMAEEIDESGRDNLIRRVDGDGGRRVGKITDRGDRISSDSDVRAESRLAAAVDHVAVNDTDVVRDAGRFCCGLRLQSRCSGRAGESENDCGGDAHANDDASANPDAPPGRRRSSRPAAGATLGTSRYAGEGRGGTDSGRRCCRDGR